MIASGTMNSLGYLNVFIRYSLLATQQEDRVLEESYRAAMVYLIENEFIKVQHTRTQQLLRELHTQRQKVQQRRRQQQQKTQQQLRMCDVATSSTTNTSTVKHSPPPMLQSDTSIFSSSSLSSSSSSATAIISATQLGKATFASGMSPSEGVLLMRELARARQGLSLKYSLHMCYHLAPIYQLSTLNVDWILFRSKITCMSEGLMEVVRKCGVTMQIISRAGAYGMRACVHEGWMLKYIYWIDFSINSEDDECMVRTYKFINCIVVMIYIC